MGKAKTKRNNTRNTKQSKPKLPKISEREPLLIYQSLLDIGFSKDIVDKLEQLDDDENLNSSILILLMNLCGLASSLNDANFNPTLESIPDVLERAEEGSEKLSEIRLTNRHSKDYDKLQNACGGFWEGTLFSDANDLIDDTKVLDVIATSLQMFSTSKIRSIRIASLSILHQLIEKCLPFYKSLPPGSTKTTLLRRFMAKVNIAAKERLLDVDISIRKKACSILLSYYQGSPDEILSTAELNQSFGMLICNNSEENIILGTDYLRKTYTIPDNHFLITYANHMVPKLIDNCISRPGTLFPTAQLLGVFKFYSPEIALSLDTVARILECSSGSKRGVTSVFVELFFATICEGYRETRSKIRVRETKYSRIVVSAIVEGFSLEFGDKANKNNLFKALISFDEELFNIQNMMVLLLEEGLVNEQGQFKKMNLSELSCLLQFISAYAQFLKEKKQANEDNLIKYTQVLMKNVSTLVTQHLIAHPSCIDLYMQLLLEMNFPLEERHAGTVELILDQIRKLFKTPDDKGKYKMLEVVRLLKPEAVFYLLDDLHFDALNNMNQDEIAKLACIAGGCDFTKVLPHGLIEKLMEGFLEKTSTRTQANILSILSSAHKHKFEGLFSSHIDRDTLDAYIDFRNNFIGLLMAGLRDPNIQKDTKSATFQVLCRMLNLILHPRFSEVEFLYYPLTDDLVQTIFVHLATVFTDSDKPEKMFLALEEKQEIKPNEAEALVSVFSVITYSAKFGTSPLSIELAYTMLRRSLYRSLVVNHLNYMVEEEAKKESSNRYIFLRLFKSVVLNNQFPAEKRVSLVDPLLNCYFKSSFGKDMQDALTNKFVVFFAQTVSQAFSKTSTEEFNVVTAMAKRIKGRIPPMAWARLMLIVKKAEEETKGDFSDSKEYKSFTNLMTKNAKIQSKRKENSPERLSVGSSKSKSESEPEKESNSRSLSKKPSATRSRQESNKESSEDEASPNRRESSDEKASSSPEINFQPRKSKMSNTRRQRKEQSSSQQKSKSRSKANKKNKSKREEESSNKSRPKSKSKNTRRR